MAEKKTAGKKTTSKKLGRPPKPKDDGILICNTTHLAEMYGVSERQIYNQTDNGIAVKVGLNKYDAVASVRNYIMRMREQQEKRNRTPEEIRAEQEAVKLDHERLKARKTELQVLEMEGKLHYEDDVKSLWNGIVVAAKSRLAAIGVKLAPQLRGETDEGAIQELIDREIYEALKELSEYDLGDFEEEMLGRIESEKEDTDNTDGEDD